MSEQVLLEQDAAAPEQQAQAAVERMEHFIESKPPTQGVYAQESLSDAPDGVYVSPALATAQEKGLPHLTEVELMPGAQLGAGDSHHSVIFAHVAVNQGDQTHMVATAIKGFESKSGAAEHEHDCLVTVAERGFNTYTPVALARDGDTTYLITRWQEEVSSLDNENWTISPRDKERYQESVVPSLHFMANTMAQLHAKGIFHGDAQPKNFARTDVGETVVFDFENTTIAQDEAENIALVSGGWDVRDSKAGEDVWHCWYALTHPMDAKSKNILMTEESYETYMQEFEENFLNPYMEALQDHATDTLRAAIDIQALKQAIYNRVAMTA